MIRTSLWLGMLGVLTGCTDRYPPFSGEQIAAGLDAAERITTDALFDEVVQIAEARLADPEQESYGDRCHPEQDCLYSRAATAGLIRGWMGAPHEQTVDDPELSTTNLWVEFEGQTRAEEWVLAVAHYDAWFAGANDNGTGTALLVELARALEGSTLDRSVRILWVDGEEFGMVGTNRYLEEYGDDDVVMVLDADMIAHVGDQGNRLTAGGAGIEYFLQANEDSAGAAYQLADLARRLPEPVEAEPIVYPGDGVSLGGVAFGYALSDHAPFWLRGTPALFPFPTGDLPEYYHTPRDLPERVDQGRLRRIARLYAAGIAAFATVGD